MNKSNNKIKPVNFLIFYLCVSMFFAILYTIKAKPDSFIKELYKINISEVFTTFTLIFLLSFSTSMIFATTYFSENRKITLGTFDKINIKAMLSICSVVAIVFALAINLTVYQFELVLDALGFSTLFIFSIKTFLNYTKDILTSIDPH